MSAEHEIKMSCFCPERHRNRYKDGTSECTYCGREWNTEADKERAKRARRLKLEHGSPFVHVQLVRVRMKEGMYGGKAVWMEYIDRNNELSERLVKPVEVKRTAVKAYCFARKAERLFIFDRVHRCKVVEHEATVEH